MAADARAVRPYMGGGERGRVVEEGWFMVFGMLGIIVIFALSEDN